MIGHGAPIRNPDNGLKRVGTRFVFVRRCLALVDRFGRPHWWQGGVLVGDGRGQNGRT